MQINWKDWIYFSARRDAWTLSLFRFSVSISLTTRTRYKGDPRGLTFGFSAARLPKDWNELPAGRAGLREWGGYVLEEWLKPPEPS